MINEIKDDAQTRMNKSIESFKSQLAKVRTGRAHPSLLDGIMVPYYGSNTPLRQVGNVSTEDARIMGAITSHVKKNAQVFGWEQIHLRSYR